MSDAASDPTRRFSDRKEDYVRYRPGYPDGLVRQLEASVGLSSASIVADIGSGTGISSELFLRLGCRVFAVEPNPDMRLEAEQKLSSRYAGFQSVPGSAEKTLLAEKSVDIVTVGQAFHWFHIENVKIEFARILRSQGRVCLFWNKRSSDDAFGAAYERLMQQYGTDYKQRGDKEMGEKVLGEFFIGSYQRYAFDNVQTLDRDGLVGRLRSSSFTPPMGHPNHQGMLRAVDTLFKEYAESGGISMRYETKLFVGRVLGV